MSRATDAITQKPVSRILSPYRASKREESSPSRFSPRQPLPGETRLKNKESSKAVNKFRLRSVPAVPWIFLERGRDAFTHMGELSVGWLASEQAFPCEAARFLQPEKAFLFYRASALLRRVAWTVT